MTLEYTFACPLANGIHARPASAIERIAERFSSNISIVNQRTGRTANAKSVLSMVGADFKFNDACCLIVSGQDEQAAFETIHTFVRDQFPSCDEPLPDIKVPEGQVRLPPLLRAAHVSFYSGNAVVEGIGMGQAVFMDSLLNIFRNAAGLQAGEPQCEQANINNAINALDRKISRQLTHAAKVEAGILDAHLSILRDPELIAYISRQIESSRCSAGQAICAAAEHFSDILRATGSLILRERILDIQDVCMALINEIYGDVFKTAKAMPAAPSICIAENLTPSQLLSLDRTFLKGLVLTNAGTTSHTVILARSFGIPTLTGIRDLPHDAAAEVILDGNLGILITDISPAVRRYYEFEERKAGRKKQQLQRFINCRANTRDGRHIEIAANIAAAKEIETALNDGADGVGMFRTEMFFLERNSAPSEQEQFEAYRQVVEKGRTVIIRTVDVGGDKHLDYLNIPAEDNPFLGYRAVRIYPEFANVIRDQLRAILRASAFGKIKLMIPMVSCVEEVRWVKETLSAIRAQLDAENIAYDKSMAVGIMVEVPSAVFIIDQLAKEIDFFSIGTNDLTQYFLAADRQNAKVSRLYSPLHPSFIRLLKKIVDDVHGAGKWVGVCGEMAGQPENVPLLVGLGLDELSLSSPHISAVKAAISRADLAQCGKLVESAMQSATVEDVRRLLNAYSHQNVSLPIIDTDLIILDSDSRSRHEVIKEVIDNLYVFGRTDQPDTVEEEIWKREEVYSTGLGYGFAVPHCSSDALLANCISVVKLKNPVEWNSADSKPVDVVIMLAIRSSEKEKAHMQIFARLARNIMHDEFRSALRSTNDAKSLLDYIKSSLELGQVSC
jgi:phosphoenolpyruvate-protein phosphotransferase